MNTAIRARSAERRRILLPSGRPAAPARVGALSTLFLAALHLAGLSAGGDRGPALCAALSLRG